MSRTMVKNTVFFKFSSFFILCQYSETNSRNVSFIGTAT